jgi:RimJ/RimL family protein N-acetyltransferase
MIRGEKVVLRAPEPEDLERCYVWMNDREVTRFTTMRFPISRGAELKWLQQDRDPAQVVELAIESLEGEHIGNCGLMRVDHLCRSAELGIVIGDKNYWARGYGTDAVLTLCGFGFAEMNLNRIELHVYDYNSRGIACYEKCGFSHEGRRRAAGYREGATHDILIMGLLADEYRDKWPQRWGTLS